MRYHNPVYPFDFADPFVLQSAGGYYAYGTAAPGGDGRIFPVLHSADLIHWDKIGGALLPLIEPRAHSYWAPEVAQKDGQFYLFYSASTSPSDEHHRLRVAVASSPAGPFVDSGKLLVPQLGFSIDASPFCDPRTGKYYLFFATDYETDEPHGTGLAVAELADDLLSVTTAPNSVIRAQADWQIYERNREYKLRTWAQWNCVEGPSAVFHEGKYYCFYSGGAWHGNDYGVGFAVADHPLGPWRDDSAAFGPVVLKGIPGKVIGPGHNSCVMGPDGHTLFMVYHAWDASKSARRMCIDPVVFGRRTDPRWMAPALNGGLFYRSNCGIGWIDGVGDAGTLLRHGASAWVMAVGGLGAMALGLVMWHRMGLPRGKRSGANGD